ncbi:MAG: DUF4249 family protein [Muribaculaceae bacterium]
MKHFKLMAIVLLALICSCDDDEPLLSPDAEMPIVVEGWIENGEYPVVIITRAIDLTKPMDDLESYVEKWFRVSIHDGVSRYYLTARINKNYIPSFIYTSSRLRGQVGKEYELMIETETDTFTATTRILEPLRIDSVKVQVSKNDASLYQISAFANIDSSTPNKYYKFFSKLLSEEKRYYSSFLGTFESVAYDSTTGYNVAKGIHNTFEGDQKFSPLFNYGDTVDVKLCTISREQFDFWSAYENSVSLSGQTFFNVARGCPSNINGALGYWFGYGASAVRVVVK